MKLIDVHCHLDLLDNVPKEPVLIITSGFDKETNRKSLELKEKYPNVECSLGIYPLDQLKREKKFEEFDVDEEIEFIRKNKDKIVAVGEVGMDFSENPDKQEQEKVFVKMIKLAKELKKPIVIHSRKAEKEVIEILKREKAKKVIMHCFSGNKQLIKEAAEAGFSFSIPANVNRASNFQTIVKLVSINQLFTETDAPFLSPDKERKSNPSDVKVAIKEIAKIKGFEEEEVANNILLNWQRIR